MNEAAGLDWMEVNQILQEHYPNLPPREAFVNFLRDVFINHPPELMKRIPPGMLEKLQGAADIAMIIGVLRGSSLVQASALAMSMVEKVFAKWSQSGVNTVTAAKPSTVLEQATVGVSKMATPAFESAITRDSDTMLPNVDLLADNIKGLAGSAEYVTRELHGIHVIGNSLVDHINYYGRWMQTVSSIQIAQGYQAIQALNVICDHLRDSNIITVSGGGGSDGFARPVYDFIQKSINDIDQTTRDNHRFFVFHPDTNWYGAFHRLIRENPLPPEFCAKADNLDTTCLFMQDIRTSLAEQSDHGKDIIFHLLIPSWYSLAIEEPLHFPDSLYPLRVEGEKHKRKELVQLNLPAAPAGLLHGVANVLDPKGLNKIAAGASVVTTLPGVGWGVNGACLALGLGIGTITGLGAFVAVPIWLGTAMPAMSTAAPVIGETVYNALCEEAPRVLGSAERLNMRQWRF
ncbi:uncharacterized protein N7496_003773 [Penicillium cataractarum]|uniref:Uncharacterized protein n=1 Tax=Penicillium cataractarum TaxID=2100454 RepID=A0A9W9SNP4_9EURO|nr:uncharacterized protein N7496_003773 [Penicillium cataractarum]KAJ5381345.1 hypothetical protein N7496_003773 [Penicillium cataractarum]